MLIKADNIIGTSCTCTVLYIKNKYLTYSRWTLSLPSCLWSLRIFPSLPGSRLTIFCRDASSAILQLVNQWLHFTYQSRSHAFRYGRKNTNLTLVRIELTISALTSRYAGYLLHTVNHSGAICIYIFLDVHLTCSRWISSLPSCLWTLRIFPSLPGSRLTTFYRDASSALLQLVNQWSNFTYSRSYGFRYRRKNTNPALTRTELTTSALLLLAELQLKAVLDHCLYMGLSIQLPAK